MTTQTEPRKLPRRIAALLASFSQKLTGEQMADCIRETERIYDPTLNFQADRIVRWVLDDEEVAAWYGFERAEGLAAIRDAKQESQRALDAVTRTGSFSVVEDMWDVERNSKSCREKYLAMIEGLKDVCEMEKAP